MPFGGIADKFDWRCPSQRYNKSVELEKKPNSNNSIAETRAEVLHTTNEPEMPEEVEIVDENETSVHEIGNISVKYVNSKRKGKLF